LSDYKYKIFIGYDSRENLAYEVCKSSLISRCKQPQQLDIVPLKLKDLIKSGVYKREVDPLASTEFTFSRFLVPHLAGFEGWALFIDCDFLYLDDVRKLFAFKNEDYAVMCAQHDYAPKEETKMDGQQQHIYPRKNWSSMVLWNCGHKSNKQVTADFVNNPDITGQYVHRFSWLKDGEIGELSHEWNWLVGWYKEPMDGEPRALHFTEGGPWFKEYQKCEYAVDWMLQEQRYQKEKQREEKHKEGSVFENLSPDTEQLLLDVLDYKVDPTGNYFGKDINYIRKKMEKTMGKVAAIDSDGGIAYKRFGQEYDGLLAAFIQGSGGIISDYDREAESDNELVIRGLGGGSRKALHKCHEQNRIFYYIDSGYFGNWKNKYIHRVTKNSVQYKGPILHRDNDRAKRFGYKFNKFTPGKSILICPPSQKVMNYFNQDLQTWIDSTVAEIKKRSDRPIIVRQKPSRSDRISSDTIQQALSQNIHCLVTYNSIAAIEAMMEGKPAITMGPNAASEICETDLKNIENPRVPFKDEMEAFMHHLAYAQFTVDEMKSGFAWRTINESDSISRWNPTD
jgi:lipopolysaccharide biosynthesis glycosyltransferase